jgi:hypothetical protein
MKKTNSSYKMKRQTKIFLARELNSHRRGELKRTFIDAELAAAVRPKLDKKAVETAKEE